MNSEISSATLSAMDSAIVGVSVTSTICAGCDRSCAGGPTFAIIAASSGREKIEEVAQANFLAPSEHLKVSPMTTNSSQGGICALYQPRNKFLEVLGRRHTATASRRATKIIVMQRTVHLVLILIVLTHARRARATNKIKDDTSTYTCDFSGEPTHPPQIKEDLTKQISNHMGRFEKRLVRTSGCHYRHRMPIFVVEDAGPMA